MQEIIKTTLLEYGKSNFLIDLIQFKEKQHYVSITQTIKDKTNQASVSININPLALEDIIAVLSSYKKSISKEDFPTVKTTFSQASQQEIIRRYFLGVELKDIALQFDCNIRKIENVLLANDIEIVSNKLEDSAFAKGRIRKNRKRKS